MTYLLFLIHERLNNSIILIWFVLLYIYRIPIERMPNFTTLRSDPGFFSEAWTGTVTKYDSPD